MRVAESGAGTRRRILIVILLAFVTLAVTYSVSVPLGEAPDEVPHFKFVRFLADNRTLPEGAEAGSEGFQPPLYYAIGALATSWIPAGNFEMRANTDFSWDSPETSRNLLLHTSDEAFPYQGGALAWHVVRLLSILMGTITIVATYLIGREIFPTRPSIALGMAAINAFIPEFVFMSSVVNNDNLIAMLSALLMLKLIRIIKGAVAWRDFVQLGSLLGLSLMAKSSAIAFVPLTLMVLFSTPGNKKLSLLQSSLWSGVTAIFALGFSGWWFLRNYFMFGDPLGWSLKVSMSDLRQTPLGWKDLQWLVEGLFQSFWGRFGGAAHLRLNSSLYLALGILSLAAFAGCMLAVIRMARSRRPFENPSAVLIVLAALNVGLVAAALVRWTMTFLGTDQARLLYPALPALILFFLLGLLQLVPTRLRGFTIVGLGFALFTLAVLVPFNFIGPVYRPPEVLSSTDMPFIPHPTSYDFDGITRLVGYEFDEELNKPGETARLILYWQTLGEIREAQWLQIQLVDRTGKVVYQKEGCPSGGSYSADLWQFGEVIPSTHYLRLGTAIPADAYSLRLAMRPASSKAWVPIFDRLTGWVGDNVAVAKIRIGEKDELPASGMEQPVKGILGSKFSLLGYTVRGDERLKPVERLFLTLYWQKLPGVVVDTKFTVFAQLLDPTGAVQAQVDSQPVRGNLPTTVWNDTEIIVDAYEMIVNRQALPGDYSLIVGMYDGATLKRLPTTDAGGNPTGDSLKLADLKIP